MANDPFLSFKEAAELVGKSKKTIERFHKKHKGEPDYAGAFQQKPRGSGVQYFIRESVVRKDIMDGASGKAKSAGISGVAEEAIREALNQVKVKDRQIETKDRQIENLQQSLQAEQALHLTAAKKKSLLFLPFGKQQQPEGDYSHATSRNSTFHVATWIVLSTLAVTLALIQTLKLALPLFL